MIDVRELRIGNWVHHNPVRSNRNEDEPYKEFDFEFDDFYDWIEYAYDDDWISPIPITAEWLEMLGFERNESIQQDYSYTIDAKARLVLCYYKGDPNCLSIEQDGNLFDLWHGSTKYVHQLQNLYFALTGSELTVKETTETK